VHSTVLMTGTKGSRYVVCLVSFHLPGCTVLSQSHVSPCSPGLLHSANYQLFIH